MTALVILNKSDNLYSQLTTHILSPIQICYIFRQPRKTAFSIEKVFSQVIASIKNTCNVQEVYLPYSKVRPANIAANLKSVKKRQADVFHITGDVHYVAMALPKRKTVLTIHDCVFIENSIGLKRKILKYFFLQWPVKHVAVITTISQKSKNDIIRYTGCEEKKIRVIPNPVGSSIYYKSRPFNTSKPVVLFLGSIAHKNLSRVIEALQGISCHLDIIGTISTVSQALINRYDISVSHAANISEKEVADKYAAADIILFPSLYEGFGLPIIEGNKAGRVVITSNISPMNEIAADAACLVDPFDVTSIRAGVLKVIADENYRAELIENGFENVKRFAPAYIAQQYLEIYDKIKIDNDKTS